MLGIVEAIRAAGSSAPIVSFNPTPAGVLGLFEYARNVQGVMATHGGVYEGTGHMPFFLDGSEGHILAGRYGIVEASQDPAGPAKKWRLAPHSEMAVWLQSNGFGERVYLTGLFTFIPQTDTIQILLLGRGLGNTSVDGVAFDGAVELFARSLGGIGLLNITDDYGKSALLDLTRAELSATLAAEASSGTENGASGNPSIALSDEDMKLFGSEEFTADKVRLEPFTSPIEKWDIRRQIESFVPRLGPAAGFIGGAGVVYAPEYSEPLPIPKPLVTPVDPPAILAGGFLTEIAMVAGVRGGVAGFSPAVLPRFAPVGGLAGVFGMPIYGALVVGIADPPPANASAYEKARDQADKTVNFLERTFDDMTRPIIYDDCRRTLTSRCYRLFGDLIGNL